MPTATIELPRDMVDAASSYAEREHKSMVDLFANALRVAYGIDCIYVARTEPKVHIKQREISPRVEALYGSLRLSPKLEDTPDDELKRAYFSEKYGEFK